MTIDEYEGERVLISYDVAGSERSVAARVCQIVFGRSKDRTPGPDERPRASSGGAVWCGLASRSWSCRRRMRRISRNDRDNSGFGLRELPFRSTDHPAKRFEGYPKAALNRLSTVEGEEYHRVGTHSMLPP